MKKPGQIVLLFVLAAVMGFSACSGSSAQVDCSALASKLANDITHDEALTELDSAAIERVYRIDSGLYTAAAAYAGSGATVDEVCVWEAKDDASAKEIESALASRIETRKSDYADYKPEEVPKLDDAVLTRSGNYVILCVSPDSSAAESAIKDTLGS